MPPALLCNCVVSPLSSAHLQVVPNFRVGTIPVLGTTPAIFGLACAAYILCQLAGQPIAPEPHFRVPVSEAAGWRVHGVC